LLEVWGRPPAQGLLGKRQVNIYINKLQLQAGGRREKHTHNYRGCSHAKDEVRKRKLQTAPKTTTGRVFSSSFTIPGLSFVAALRAKAVTVSATMKQPRIPAPVQHQQQQETCQSVRGPDVNNLSLDIVFRVAIVVQQIMTV
jgi:hypothetical protein